MTIAVGFLCNGGADLIVAADRQFTSPGFFKYHRKKYITEERGACSFAFAFSGEPGTFQEFQQKVFGFFDNYDDLSVEIVQETMSGVLASMGLMDRSIPPSFFVLAGFNVFLEAPKMIVFDGKSIFVAENEVHIVGCGESSVIRYLGDQLYSPDLPLNQGVALGAYLIKKATQYVDYCGEPIDVIHGDAYGFQVIEKDTVKAGIEKIEEQEQYLSTLLIQTPFLSP